MKAFIGLAVTAVAVAAVFAVATLVPAGQASDTPRPLPRLEGKPNLTGLWQALSEANWDLEAHEARPGPAQFGALFSEPGSVGVVEDNEIPYQPSASATRQENFAKRWTNDPEAKCYLPGVPRATYLPFPFQILQSTDRVVIAYQFANASRTIPLGKPSEAPVDFWMGWSNGQWEGDTLVVDVKGFNDMTWFDRAGNFHSDALHVVERYTPMSPYHVNYEATIDDPKVFTRPWKMTMPLYRRVEKNAQLLEFKCVDLSEEYLYGGLVKQSSQ